MADFDLTQTDAQVQSILNDAQNAQGAGAQTTLTTEYIMLKDTSGSYHKILKDSFTEACRNVLADLLVNNDKGTTINEIPAIASGDFGSVTPANLASVLGAPTVEFLSDFNNAPNGRTVWVVANNTILNAPNNGLSDYRGILQTAIDGNFKYQLYTELQNTKTFCRASYDANTWSSWKEVTTDMPSFYKDYSTLASLATALGVRGDL